MMIMVDNVDGFRRRQIENSLGPSSCLELYWEYWDLGMSQDLTMMVMLIMETMPTEKKDGKQVGVLQSPGTSLGMLELENI